MADFNGSEGGPINLATAKKWAANYRATLKNPDDTVAHYFGFEIIQKILREPGCVGLRIYYGIDDKGAKQLMIVGADAKGNNLLPSSVELKDGDDNTIADNSMPCPVFCPNNGL